jgi:methionyl-tRNA synthetase
VVEKLNGYKFDEAMSFIWEDIRKADGLINQRQVWKLEGEEKKKSLSELVKMIRQIGTDLSPFLPETEGKIMAQYGVEEIKKSAILFQRLG